jgi:hypothetical protein
MNKGILTCIQDSVKGAASEIQVCPLSADNMSQDLLRLSETMDNTERYI